MNIFIKTIKKLKLKKKIDFKTSIKVYTKSCSFEAVVEIMVQPQEREKNHLDFTTLRVSHCEPNDMTQTYLNTFYDLEINSVIGITIF